MPIRESDQCIQRGLEDCRKQKGAAIHEQAGCLRRFCFVLPKSSKTSRLLHALLKREKRRPSRAVLWWGASGCASQQTKYKGVPSARGVHVLGHNTTDVKAFAHTIKQRGTTACTLGCLAPLFVQLVDCWQTSAADAVTDVSLLTVDGSSWLVFSLLGVIARLHADVAIEMQQLMCLLASSAFKQQCAFS